MTVERFVADAEKPGLGVTYGPAIGTDDWKLTVITEEGRVELLLDEPAMYSLWIEVRGVPWPARENTEAKDRLIRRLVQLANGADVERIEDAISMLGGRP